MGFKVKSKRLIYSAKAKNIAGKVSNTEAISRLRKIGK